VIETPAQRANRWYTALVAVGNIQERFELADTFFKELIDESDDRIVITTMQAITDAFAGPNGGYYIPEANHKWFGKLVKRYSDRLLHEDPELMAIIKEGKANPYIKQETENE
jgi:hypothetical protein